MNALPSQLPFWGNVVSVAPTTGPGSGFLAAELHSSEALP